MSEPSMRPFLLANHNICFYRLVCRETRNQILQTVARDGLVFYTDYTVYYAIPQSLSSALARLLNENDFLHVFGRSSSSHRAHSNRCSLPASLYISNPNWIPQRRRNSPGLSNPFLDRNVHSIYFTTDVRKERWCIRKYCLARYGTWSRPPLAARELQSYLR